MTEFEEQLRQIVKALNGVKRSVERLSEQCEAPPKDALTEAAVKAMTAELLPLTPAQAASIRDHYMDCDSDDGPAPLELLACTFIAFKRELNGSASYDILRALARALIDAGIGPTERHKIAWVGLYLIALLNYWNNIDPSLAKEMNL